MKGQLRIDQLFAFVVLDDDGTEGVPAVRSPDGMILMPLMGADMARVDSLRPLAEMMAKEMKKPVRLVKFTHREELEEIH